MLAAGALAVPAEPVLGGQADVNLYRSGNVRYAVLDDTQGPGSLSLDLECPVGTRATGGGGSLAGSGTSSTISGLSPFDTGDADGDADDGFDFEAYKGSLVGPVRVRAVAICLKGGQDDLVYAEFPDVTPAGELSAANSRSCPADSRLAGVGFEADGSNSQVGLRRLGADVQGGVIDQFELIWGIVKNGGELNEVIHVVCVDLSGRRMRYVLESRQVAEGRFVTIKADCPGGTRVVGGGYGDFPRTVLRSAPFDDGDRGKAPDDGWATKLLGSAEPDPDYAEAFCMK